MVRPGRTDKPFLPIGGGAAMGSGWSPPGMGTSGRPAAGRAKRGSKMRIAAGSARPILPGVKKAHRSRALVASSLLAAATLVSGCGGFSGSHSVSPASILLPGLLKADPPAPGRSPGHPAGPEDRVALASRAGVPVAIASLPQAPAGGDGTLSDGGSRGRSH